MFIQTETTPNDNSLKFKPGRAVTGNGVVEFLSRNEARRGSELADELFRIEGVQGVMFGGDFITVTKGEMVDWKHIKPSVFAAIMDHLSMNKPILKADIIDENEGTPIDPSKYSPEDYETVTMIREILDSRIRPTVQDDGGDVQFVSFKDGVVELQLRGACRSCSSSVVTLKHGIENMLMHYIPEVKEVRQVEDPLEKSSEEYFEKVETQKLDPEHYKK